MKIFKTTNAGCVFILCIIILSCSVSPSILAYEENDKDGYKKLVNLYKEYFRIEEDLFRRLSFRLSDKQLVLNGSSFKLTLEDNLGGKWIFKDKGANRVIAHKIYALFGISSPQIHKMRLRLNGKIIEGTLQKFIPSELALSSIKPSGISRRGLEYIMKTQVVDWLMRDHDANMLNFLVISRDSQGKVDGLIRIDQDCACLGQEYSDLDYVHMVAIDKNLNRNLQGNYYYLIQQSYTRKEIDLDLRKAYDFLKFVADFPERLLEEIIMPLKCKRNKGLTEEDALKKKHSFLGGSILANKLNIKEDFRDFYVKLAATRNESLELSGQRQTDEELEIACDNFKKEGDLLLEAKDRLATRPSQSIPEIKARASLEGFYIMQKIYEVCWYKRANLKEECRKALKELSRLRSVASAPEKKAIDIYSAEVKKILAGKGMTLPINQINKLVDPILYADQDNQKKSRGR